MSKLTVKRINNPKGEISLPGDKSVSHRAIMISSLAKKSIKVSGLLTGLDCLATKDAFCAMGVSIDMGRDGSAIIKGSGLRGLKPPLKELDMQNSGTSMRLMLGILAGQNFKATLKGDESLSKRPMKRVTGPLRLMGARIEGRDDANLAPITIQGDELKGINYNSPVASAQVKSAILLAGLYAKGRTTITEPYKSRDHTERIFKLFGVDVKEDKNSVSVSGIDEFKSAPDEIEVPGDISSAAFFMALGVLAKGADITIKGCGVNPTRTGILDVLKRMGADISVVNKKEAFEPYADIVARYSSLKATKIKAQEVPLLIDEIPIISLIATQAHGQTTIEGIAELRVKETDRVLAIVTNLTNAGADVRSEADALIINGPTPLKPSSTKSFGDHRMAMMMAIAGALSDNETIVDDTGCIDTSFPGFFKTLKALSQ